MVDILADRAVLFIVDGMRPDALKLASTPVMDALIANGASTMSARTVMPSITLPCHASLFLSATPERHGVNTNTWVTPTPPIPGLTEVLHEGDLRAVSFYNWEELRDLSSPGSLTASFYPCGCDEPRGDQAVAHLAADWLRHNDYQFAFIYLGYADVAGHSYGWMSRENLEAISQADRLIGVVLDAVPGEALVVITSDHGGHEHMHGTDCDADMTIPLILAGGNIPAGRSIDREVSIVDIAPTILHHLGVDQPAEWAGRPIQVA